MKYSILAILALASLVSTVSAATGSTTPALTCLTGLTCAGGPTRAFNYTKNSYDMLPQCFPWIFASEYFSMNIANMYANQEYCRAQRLLDFRM